MKMSLRMNLRIGSIGRIFSSLMCCSKCDTPFSFVQCGPTIRTFKNFGHFSMCQKCWDESSIEQRVCCFRVHHGYKAEWSVIESKIRAEKEGASSPYVLADFATLNKEGA